MYVISPSDALLQTIFHSVNSTMTTPFSRFASTTLFLIQPSNDSRKAINFYPKKEEGMINTIENDLLLFIYIKPFCGGPFDTARLDELEEIEYGIGFKKFAHETRTIWNINWVNGRGRVGERGEMRFFTRKSELDSSGIANTWFISFHCTD